jgi:hypothetical protein
MGAPVTPIIFARYLDTNGDGTGIKLATGNYSSAAEQFYLQRLIVYIEDALSGQLDPDEYGAVATLTNGILVQVRDSSETVITDYTDGIPIKSNGQWQRVCFEVTSLSGASNASLAARWQFNEFVPKGYEYEGETPLVLTGGEKLVVTVNDDLTGLISHTFMAQGIELLSPTVVTN